MQNVALHARFHLRLLFKSSVIFGLKNVSLICLVPLSFPRFFLNSKFTIIGFPTLGIHSRFSVPGFSLQTSFVAATAEDKTLSVTITELKFFVLFVMILVPRFHCKIHRCFSSSYEITTSVFNNHWIIKLFLRCQKVADSVVFVRCT